MERLWEVGAMTFVGPKKSDRGDTFYSVRHIQAYWRCKALQTTYTQDVVALRIRSPSHQTAYEQYRAARRIQSAWHCVSLHAHPFANMWWRTYIDVHVAFN
jgi:hypothetical protein